jgi:hypothetical protein
MSDAAILESVFLQGRYAGVILARRPKGYEAYDHLQRSLGTYPSKERARQVLQGEEAPCTDC